jgi:hypothetical protein
VKSEMSSGEWTTGGRIFSIRCMDVDTDMSSISVYFSVPDKVRY